MFGDIEVQAIPQEITKEIILKTRIADRQNLRKKLVMHEYSYT